MKSLITVFLLSIFVNLYQSQLDSEILLWRGQIDDRNEQLIQKIKQSMQLEMFKENLPHAFQSSKEMTFKDSFRNEYSVSIINKDLVDSGDSGVIINPDVFHASLNGYCVAFAAQYWIYEWCHEKEVRQFHIEGEVVNGDVRVGKKNPDWSLGQHKKTKYVREGKDNKNMSAPITSVIQYFDGGQYCDEIDDGRKSRVVLQCCADLPVDQSKPKAVVVNVHESDVCSYDIIVCTSVLCRKDAKTPEDLSLAAIVKLLLAPPCMNRHEEWWMYELCFDKSIRQFHSRVVPVMQDNQQVNLQLVLESEFFLGYPPSPETFTNETALEEMVAGRRVSSSPVPGGAESSSPFFGVVRGLGGAGSLGTFQPSLRVEFSGGSPCDLLANATRGTTVEVTCGLRDEITDVVEDRTCHYLLKVTSRHLCRSQIFAPQKREVVQLGITKTASGPVPTSSGVGTTSMASSRELLIGNAVEGNWQGRGVWYPGKISRVNGDGTFDIAYDDGDHEKAVPRMLIYKLGDPTDEALQKSGGELSATSNRQQSTSGGSRPSTGGGSASVTNNVHLQ